ncbi:MAG: ferritin-like domain-containing protein [Parvibaculum sp.]|uniref:ferritin-like domain-containing protein n=1 Tax=Parvibaculum sp. TaxID=2024848 RepID=UPI00272631D7|nr:ferritin-like domain-containing protein [Parvibaculum sp.]MDO8838178.1 ferritin-like domain-containing protein [Parvibaculum sp.]
MRKKCSLPSRNSRPVTGTSLVEGAYAVLACADPDEKAHLAGSVAEAWRASALTLMPANGAMIAMPDRPSRPATPALLAPRDMPRRTFKGTRGRIALLHSLAHIELNAIDLAFDLVGRFAGADLPRAFFDDWVSVGNDEARHFAMLQTRLAALGARYGDLPAHDGLWQAATETRHDLMARLAVVPLVLEARGLDVTPGMIERLETSGDSESATVLKTIYRDEQDHVRAGAIWFSHLCHAKGLEPQETFQQLVRRHFRGVLKPPFNEAARRAAGLTPEFYEPLASRPDGEIQTQRTPMVNSD